MFLKLIEKKGFKRSLLLFKEWYEKTHAKQGRIYKWNVFQKDWTEEHQMNEFRDFFFDQHGEYLTCKMMNGRSFKLVVNKKIMPRTFTSPSEAYKYYTLKKFKLIESQLIKEERVDPIKLQEAKRKKEAIEEAKKERQKKEKEAQAERIKEFYESHQRRKDSESENI